LKGTQFRIVLAFPTRPLRAPFQRGKMGELRRGTAEIIPHPPDHPAPSFGIQLGQTVTKVGICDARDWQPRAKIASEIAAKVGGGNRSQKAENSDSAPEGSSLKPMSLLQGAPAINPA
jgi:hypothetical protein